MATSFSASPKPAYGTLSRTIGLMLAFGLLLPLRWSAAATPAEADSSRNLRLQQSPLPSFQLPYKDGQGIRWTGGPHEFGLLDQTATFEPGQGSGMDFSNGFHFEVLAMAAGTVVEATCNGYGSLGCIVAIKHDDGSVLIYAHLDPTSTEVVRLRYAVDKDRGLTLWAPKGVVIGKAGNSGGQSNVHLHVELRDGSSTCTRHCVVGPNGVSLGGNPIGWDDLVDLVDGYRISGYYDVDADLVPLRAYNYDGSAVKGGISALYDFKYLDQPGGIQRTVAARVSSSFDPATMCHPSGPGWDCENNSNPLTQFAGNGVFDAGSSGSLAGLGAAEAGPSSSGSGELISSNVPNGSIELPPDNTQDAAAFLADVTLPDGTIVSSNQSLTKTWRLRNTGTTTWGGGYQLVFVRGEQMGAPSSVGVASTSPGATLDISVNLKGPATAGEHVGYWQLRNPQGTYFGDQIWVKLRVPDGPPPPSGDEITLACADCPSVLAPGQTYRPLIRATVNTGGLLESRGDMLRNTDGNLFGAWPHVAVSGTVNTGQTYDFLFYAANPLTAPTTEGSYESKWQVWRNGNWAGQEIAIRFDVRIGGGTRPSPPALASPANWAVTNDGSTPALCVTPNGGLQYWFEVFESHDIPNSGWISSSCWTPPGLAAFSYQWHVKAKNPSSGLISDWSETRHFTINSAELTMQDIIFSPSSPSNAEEVRVYTCVEGLGGVGLGLKIEANTATDGSANGDWYWIHHLGTFCYNINDTNTWPTWGTLPLADGNHLVRAVGFGPQGQTLEKTAVFTLQRRRPNGPTFVFPSPDAFLNTRSVTFQWTPSLRVTSYRFLVGTNSNPAIGPLVDQTLGASATSYHIDFTGDYPDLYWRVVATNELGSSETTSHFSIDRSAPASSVTPLPAVGYESTFPVSWSGTDNLSGVRWFDVQYRDGNRPDSTWADWLTNVPYAASLFNGQTGHTYFFRSRALDVAGNQEAWPSGDGDTSTKVDPSAKPPTPWWNPGYASKRNLVILNTDSSTLPSGYPILLQFTPTSNPSSTELYAASLSPNKGDDFRVVYQDATELPRYVRSFSSSLIEIWFKLQSSISPNPGSDSTNYQLYYGNSSASSPPGGINSVIPEPSDGNTLGLWHFQEGNGSTVGDSSGNGRSGTASNMTWVTGKFGPAGSFNGSNSIVNIGSNSVFNASSISLEAWVYPTNAGSEQTILRKAADDGSLIYDFLVQGDGVYLRLNGNNGFAKSNTHLQNGRWYHIAGTYDGSTIRMYINGNLDGTQSYNVPLRHGSSTNLYLGGDGQYNNKYFFGSIQDARISNVARSSFAYGAFGRIVNEPMAQAGSSVAPPETGSADLVVESLASYPNPGGGIVVQALVRNQGDRETQNGFYTDLYLNHIPAGPGDYSGSLRFWVNDPIAAGGTAVLSTVLMSLPGGAPPHAGQGSETTGTLYAQADSAGSVPEPNKANNIFASGSQVCIASADAYEPDGTPATASHINVGQSQTHNLTEPGDEDWVKFVAVAGHTYTLRTSNLGVSADTYLDLYGPDALTVLGSNDDFGGALASLLTWTAPNDGSYYLKVRNWNPSAGGCGKAYDLSVSVAHESYLPLVDR